jgi:20S proteasome alpha/beta subunit
VTLLVALKASDGLVLACDSRGTFGDPRGVTAQNDAQRKARILTSHVACLIAGQGELGTTIAKQASEAISTRGVVGVTPVMEVFRETARALYAQWLPHLMPAVPPGVAAMARPDIEVIVAGYEQDDHGNFTTPRIYHLVSSLDFPPMLHDYGFALGGIALYALYLLNRLYDAQRSVDELTALAVYAITETASQDGKVGGPVQVVTVAQHGGCNQLDAAAVERVTTENEDRSTALRNSFYRRGTEDG